MVFSKVLLAGLAVFFVSNAGCTKPGSESSPEECPSELPTCTTSSCCELNCAKQLLHPDGTETRDVKFFKYDGCNEVKYADNIFLAGSCQCEVWDMCETLCNRDCEVVTAPSCAPAKSLYVANNADIYYYAMSVKSMCGVSVDTVCVTPLPKVADITCKGQQRQADFTKSTCVSFTNMPMLPNDALTLKFDDNMTDPQPFAQDIALKLTKKGNHPVITEGFLLNPDYDYLVTACAPVTIEAYTGCVDDDNLRRDF